MKRTQIEELLIRVGNLSHACGGEARLRSLVTPPVGLMERQYGYRTKLTPHYNVPARGAPLLIGFIRHGVRSQMVDVPSCPIATPPINRALPAARAAAAASLKIAEEAFAARGGKRPRGATLLLRHALGEDRIETVTSNHHDLVSEIVALPGSAAVKRAMEGAGGSAVVGNAMGVVAGGVSIGEYAGTGGRAAGAAEGAAEASAGAAVSAAAGARAADVGAAVTESSLEGWPPLRLTFKAGDFFQNNPFVVPLMVQHVLDEVRSPLPPLRYLTRGHVRRSTYGAACVRRGANPSHPHGM
jgi:hypothetical protein